ncbi:MAG: hypothetical protein R3E12_02840 [Candidatus Eisenbacteria bacterium]
MGETSHLSPGGWVQQVLQKDRAAWTAEDLTRLVHQEKIRVVSLKHVGGDGWLKTLDFVPRSMQHLRDILEGGERADGSSLFSGSGVRAEASDIVLRPRLASAFRDPFSETPSLAILCDHFDRDGSPLPISPTTIVERAWERLVREAGVELWAHAELEYFLGKHAEEVDAYGSNDRGYHASRPFVFGEDLRRSAMVTLADMGVAIKYAHSEVGYIEPDEDDDHIWEQHEIELALAPLPIAADAVVLTQWVLRNLSRTHGMRCSFDPVLRPGHAGSGMHFHFSPMKAGGHRGGESEVPKMSQESKALIGGLVEGGGALMAFANRDPGSFVRLIQGKEAPTAITWGRFNRSALVRLPILAQTAEGRTVAPPTIEFRLPDGSAHPHLLLAGVAQSMLAAREMPDLDALLEATKATAAAGAQRLTKPVPNGPEQIARELVRVKARLTAADVFPTETIDDLIRHLERST